MNYASLMPHDQICTRFSKNTIRMAGALIDRENIVRGLIKHKFGPMEAALVDEYKVIAQGIIDCLVTLPLPDSTPEGWFARRDSFSISGPDRSGFMRYSYMHGKMVYSVKNGSYWNYVLERSIPVAYNHADGYIHLPAGCEFIDMLEGLGQKCRAFLEEKENALAIAKRTIAKFSTAKSLIKAWPEIEPFVPVSATGSSMLPAIPVAEMNKLFKLP